MLFTEDPGSGGLDLAPRGVGVPPRVGGDLLVTGAVDDHQDSRATARDVGWLGDLPGACRPDGSRPGRGTPGGLLGGDVARRDAPLALLGIEEGPGIEATGGGGGELVGTGPGEGLRNS